MKFRNIILLCAGCGAFALPQAPAAEEGFVFTEEEVAAFEEEERKMQSLISNESAYKMACLQALSDLHLTVGNCYREMGKTIDFQECASAKTIAEIHQDAMEKLADKFAVDTATGQIGKGVFCRKTLAQARPNMNPATYADIEVHISRAEALLKWFTGSFARTCAIFNREYYEEVQKVARFQELTQTSEFNRMEREYMRLWEFFGSGTAMQKGLDALRTFQQNPQQNALAFFERFHNRLDTTEREAWYNEVILGAPNGLMYKYVRMKEDNSVWGADARGSELANYESRFDYWTKDRISATVELGKTAYFAAMPGSGDAAYDSYFQAVQDGPQDLFANTLNDYRTRTEPQLFQLSQFLFSFEDYLKKNTQFLVNMEKRGHRGIRECATIAAKSTRDTLNQIRDLAARLVPASHPSRSKD